MENSILETAKKALRTEINGLEEVVSQLDSGFCKAVEAILASSGKIIICGIGKSALIGQKIVSTLNSTGSRAQFLHAAEAIHGDLGLVSPEDIIIGISYSGSTPEMVFLLPHLKKAGNALIAITGNPDSVLAREADCHISVKVSEEACPNGLAPTTSTTAQLAIGDALAVALMKEKKFQSGDFARYHPGGALGKTLTAKVADYLSGQVPEISTTADIREVIISISASRHGITVVTENGKITGVVTDGDLRRALLNNQNIYDTRVTAIMSSGPKTIESNKPARDALAMMKLYNIGQLVVTENGKYIGIIDLHTLLDEGIQ